MPISDLFQGAGRLYDAISIYSIRVESVWIKILELKAIFMVIRMFVRLVDIFQPSWEYQLLLLPK